MAVSFSSVGDFIAVSILVKDLIIALDRARGSVADYQSIVRELVFLDSALLHVAQFSRSPESAHGVNPLQESSRLTAEQCRESVQRFRNSIRKYNVALSTAGSGNSFKDAARKIQWKMAGKDEDVAKFRAEISGYTQSINMLLSAANIYESLKVQVCVPPFQ